MTSTGFTSNTFQNDIGNYFISDASGTTVSDYTVNGVPLQFTAYTSGTVLTNSGFISNALGGGDLSSYLQATSSTITAEHLYNVSGTYTWTCPPLVTSISVVCVGGGGSGFNQNATAYPATSGGDSILSLGGTTICSAGGGKASSNANTSQTGGAGGTVAVGTGGAGGAGGAGVGTTYYGGGGGAGGYAGVGGTGGTSNGSGGTGSGGGGGGGASVSYTGFGSNYGGGVGIYGQGTSGTGGPYGTNPGTNGTSYGRGGSGGNNGGFNGVGGTYIAGGGNYGGGGSSYAVTAQKGPGGGGGGALAYVNNYTVTPGNNYTVTVGASGIQYNAAGVGSIGGGGGAVRIIWPGNTRTFPSTNVSTATNQFVN